MDKKPLDAEGGAVINAAFDAGVAVFCLQTRRVGSERPLMFRALIRSKQNPKSQ